MKPGGKDGRLYGIERGAAITSGALITSGFYKIQSVGAATSLPQPDTTKEGARALRAGDVVHL